MPKKMKLKPDRVVIRRLFPAAIVKAIEKATAANVRHREHPEKPSRIRLPLTMSRE